MSTTTAYALELADVRKVYGSGGGAFVAVFLGTAVVAAAS